MPGDDFLDMLSYVRTHPKDTTRLEKRFAMFMAMFGNANRGKDSPAMETKDFCMDLLSVDERLDIERRDKENNEKRAAAWRKQKMAKAAADHRAGK